LSAIRCDGPASLAQQGATVLSVGGPGVGAEMDEADLGRKAKGLHGHKKLQHIKDGYYPA